MIARRTTIAAAAAATLHRMHRLLTSLLVRPALLALDRDRRLLRASLLSLLEIGGMLGREGVTVGLHNHTRVPNPLGMVIRVGMAIRLLMAPRNWYGRFRVPMSLQSRAPI
jgi:hypothetical protein